ncbi:MAG: hypothetical protein P4L87_16540 [Formivibrio sp.]|nr:hypothetical protein [Formivibrio sp.]
MKPDERFGLNGIERQQKLLEEAQKPTPQAQDNFSRLGQTLVNLPWLLLGIAFVVWWLKK